MAYKALNQVYLKSPGAIIVARISAVRIRLFLLITAAIALKTSLFTHSLNHTYVIFFASLPSVKYFTLEESF